MSGRVLGNYSSPQPSGGGTQVQFVNTSGGPVALPITDSQMPTGLLHVVRSAGTAPITLTGPPGYTFNGSPTLVLPPLTTSAIVYQSQSQNHIVMINSQNPNKNFLLIPKAITMLTGTGADLANAAKAMFPASNFTAQGLALNTNSPYTPEKPWANPEVGILRIEIESEAADVYLAGLEGIPISATEVHIACVPNSTTPGNTGQLILVDGNNPDVTVPITDGFLRLENDLSAVLEPAEGSLIKLMRAVDGSGNAYWYQTGGVSL